MALNLTEERHHLSRAYRDLATAEQNLRHSIEALESAGWTGVANEQREALAYVRDAMHDLGTYSVGLGREL